MVYVVCVDGNIGAGKSSALCKLSKLGYTVYEEPHDWLLLDKCYKNPREWSCVFQMSVLRSMAEMKLSFEQQTSETVFIERCPESCMVFTDKLHADGYMTDDEHSRVVQLYETIGWKPDLTILIDTPAEECFARMKQRGRDCEKNVTIDYIKSLADGYAKLNIKHRVSGVLPDVHVAIENIYKES